MSWQNPPTNFTLQILEGAEKHVKKIVGEMLQQVVIKSPVMDGEFRASHKVSLNAPDKSYSKGFDLSGAATLAEGLRVASTVKIGGIVYVHTNSPYGMKLENGWSNQAPQGIYALSFQYVCEKYK